MHAHEQHSRQHRAQNCPNHAQHKVVARLLIVGLQDDERVCAVSRRVGYLTIRERLGADDLSGQRVLLWMGNLPGDRSLTRSGEARRWVA
jgi:hypothetical protein